ncbi:MAG: hypothetical protein KA248_06460 [Kiritimatiellae bacterium]|nr:hypothetical protein [Kiritimatiellia bacterium]
MKTLRFLSLWALCAMLPGLAFGEAYRGAMNSWGTNWMTQDTSFGNIWKVTVTASVTSATSTYKFDRTGNWSTNWGAGVSYTQAVKNANVGQCRINPDNGNMTNSEVTGRSYSFNLEGEGHWWYRPFVVMETDSTPVTPLAATDNHVQDPGTNPVTVSIKLSAALSTQETVWVRYATNSSFANARLTAATGSSTNYTATIPGGHNPGARVWYYVLTSTMTSTNTILNTPDLCTLRGLKSGSTNFTYRPGGGLCWHHPTNAEPAGATMRNPTNGALASAAVFFYTGNFWTNGWAMGDQTGATLYHRLKGPGGAWTATNAWYDSESGNNKYWQMRIPSGTYATTNEVEYYIRVAYNDYDTTYLGRLTDTASRTFLVEANAQAAPFSFRYGTGTNLGNCWHLPANAEPPTTTMRFPDNPYSNNAVYVYNGNQFQGSGNAADQSGGTLYHRLAGSGGGWTATNLSYDSQQENNKYWVSTIPAGAYKATNEVEYYVKVTYTDRDTTYIGTTNSGAGSLTYYAEASAQANPFRYTYGGEPGSEAGYIWHNSNRVNVASGSVQFWTKIGYAQGTGSNRWVDHVCLYYTTNGSAVGVSGKGTGDVNTLVQYLAFDHTEEDSSENGNAMWWAGTASGLPTNGTIRYKIGAWNGAGVHRFAEYNTEGEDDKEFAFSLFVDGADGLTVNGVNADYTTTKFFVNERAGETNTVTVSYVVPGSDPIEKVEVFSNLDRRDWADVDYNTDGIPDGINPPLGDTITTNDAGAYFRAYAMNHLGGRTYQWDGTASKCGAYRLTARYKLVGDSNWYWYSSDGRRDHAIVVSPKKALGMTLYEVNPLTVKATSNDKGGRSTFDDLLDGNPDSFTNFNLGYLNKIQVNCLWFQPIHPSAVTTKGDPSGYDPGSPYATRDYFSVASIMGDADTEADAMTEFTNFVQRCDSNATSVGTINIMLDGVFNHTAWDAVMGQGGVDLGYATSATQKVGHVRPGWYAYWQDYGLPATFYNTEYDNDIATAPDRGDFGKWDDVAELYFGKYSCLVRHNPDNNGDYTNEGDTYDFAGMGADTIALWKYFGYYTEFWLKKTGHPTNNNNSASDDLGIDALRCDFGQGLPPQLWEYIINRTRKMKWNFVFMAETLDGGSPGYRSNRHFDILNENLVFRFTQEHINYASSLRQALEDRRNSYSSGTVLLNLTGHDEVMPDNDPWLVASRYGSVSMVDGLPMIFYGQEWGIGLFNASDPDNKNDGFLNWHELNFGKYIPHFKQWNKLTVWQQPPDNSDGLAQWYGRVNWARLNSPALRSHNRYFLNKVGGGEEGTIMAAAKYQTAYASPQTSDVVLAFSIFFRHGEAHFSTAASFDLTGCWSLLGLDTGKTYRVRNLASSDASAYITNGWPKTGADLYNNGIYVALGGGTVNSITDDGEIVQYLKIEEYTPTNRAPVINLPGPHTLPVGSSTSFVVSATDADGHAVTLTNPTAPAGSSWDGTNFSWTALPSSYADTSNSLVFIANDQQPTNGIVTNRTYILVPYDSDSDSLPDGWEWDSFATLTNPPTGDWDGDGAPNADEYAANTQPTNVSSVFAIRSVTVPGAGTNYHIAVNTAPDRHYTIYFRNNLTNGTAWSGFGDTNLGVGTWLETSPTGGVRTFIDDQTTATSSNPPPDGRRFYRFRVRQP